MMNIDLQTQFATKLTDRSLGGLVFVGMNYGGKPRENVSHEPKGSFASSINEYPFSRRIRHWFELWGHPIERDQELDLSISQTNLFLDQSEDFNRVQRNGANWERNVERLAGGIAKIRPCGVVFFSIPTLKNASWYADRCDVASWHDLFGRNCFDSDRCAKFNRFHAFLSDESAPGCRLAAITHPAARGITDADIQRAKDVMAPWITKIRSRAGKPKST